MAWRFDVTMQWIRGWVLLMMVCMAWGSASADRVVFNMGGEPSTLDPHLNTGLLESHVINHMIEGLARMDSDGNAIPGMAERWEISDDKTSYTFFLRSAAWNNGEPVTAGDFVYGWRRCLDPETAAEYAYQLHLIRGAEEFNRGSNTDPASVQVTAESDRVLTVQLKNPTPYFLSVLSHSAYFPLKESWVKANADWASQPGKYLANGPFQLGEWRRRDRIILKKNARYYNANKTRLDEIEMTMISNESTALLQFETGKIDVLRTVPLPDIPRLKKANQLQSVPHLATYYVALNHDRKPFDDVRVRKAFALAVDREQITKAILRGGQPAAYGIVPEGIEVSENNDYRKVTGDLFKQNVAEAKKLLAEAGYPNGRGLPPIRYVYNDLEMHRTIGEALQRMWMENLGVRVQLQVMEYKVYLHTLHSKNYQMARAGWVADFVDPTAFLDMYITGAGNNSFNYSSPEFDALLAKSRVTTSTAERLALLQQAERKLIGEDMAVAPLYFYTDVFLQNPRVKGVTRDPTGGVDFREAYVEGK